MLLVIRKNCQSIKKCQSTKNRVIIVKNKFVKIPGWADQCNIPPPPPHPLLCER